MASHACQSVGNVKFLAHSAFKVRKEFYITVWKTNIFDVIREASGLGILVVADGVAFGLDMAYLVLLRRFRSIKLFCPNRSISLFLNRACLPTSRRCRCS